MASTTTSTYTTTSRPFGLRRKGGGFGIATASTPNLNALYSAHSSASGASRLAPPGLARKASFAALTQNSLAAIPDDTEYAFNSVLTSADGNDTMPAPFTPARSTMAPPSLSTAGALDEIAIGDTVDVPGAMIGTVRFIGSVQGRKGTFAGVELAPEFAARGKNSGDVDGISYFTTTRSGAGIFLPLSKALKRESPTSTASSFSMTPTPTIAGGLKVANQNSTNFTPPTPSLPKFSQSVGPGRAVSPMGKKPPRTSLPRPGSPERKLQTSSIPRSSIATPVPKPGGPGRLGSPTAASKFSQSVRGTATTGDPSKKLRERNPSIGPRSASALGSMFTPTPEDDEATPVALTRKQTNGSVSSVSSYGLKRPTSRAASRAGNSEDLDKLRAQLEQKDRQLRDQAAMLGDMEASLTELQGLIENSDGPPPPGINHFRRASTEDKDVSQLRALLREKNEKIAMLTAEFDAHRADFRSTIDTLEMASTETERVYEKKIEELMQELQDIQERTADVDVVASQLKQLEELVQELEEGLEDARRGEAEARGEVEFLRGEVERTRSELRREREKAAAVSGTNGVTKGNKNLSKELEQKEDEIRGLKAIIHSLSRDAVPNDSDKTPTQLQGSFGSLKGVKLSEDRSAHEKVERELSELRSAMEKKNRREEELEREIELLRRGGGGPTTGQRGSVMTIGSANGRNSVRDSRDTVVLAPRSPEAPRKSGPTNGLGLMNRQSRGQTLDTMPESDAYSTATENSTLWCEICETSGHDILTCTNMFGDQAAPLPPLPPTNGTTGKDAVCAEPKSLAPPELHEMPAPLSPVKTKAPSSIPPDVKIIPNPMETGPVAGKESGVVDPVKWCAVCERDGHDSVDCPFEDAF